MNWQQEFPSVRVFHGAKVGKPDGRCVIKSRGFIAKLRNIFHLHKLFGAVSAFIHRFFIIL